MNRWLDNLHGSAQDADMERTATTKGNTMTAVEMMARMSAHNTSMGLDHRCPTCNAGIQKWCFDPEASAAKPKATIGTFDLRGTDGKRQSHSARLAALSAPVIDDDDGTPLVDRINAAYDADGRG